MPKPRSISQHAGSHIPPRLLHPTQASERSEAPLRRRALMFMMPSR